MLIKNKTGKFISADAGTVLDVYSAKKNFKLVFMGRWLFLDNLIGVVDMSHIDLLELIERDESRELLSVPLYVSLWPNRRLYISFFSFYA